MAVERCVCHDVSFDEIRRALDVEGLDFAAIQRRTQCCTGCGMCEPYVRLVLETGRTRLPVLSPEEVASVMRRAREGH